MHNVSDLYKEIIQDKYYQTENALVIGGSGPASICSDAQLEAMNPYYKNVIRSMTTSSAIFTDSEHPVGNCNSRKINIVMYKPSEPIPRQARLVPYVRVVSIGRKSEWIPKGVYYVDTRRESHGGGGIILELEGYDSMMKAEQLYKESELDSPADCLAIVNEIAAPTKMDVHVDSRTQTILRQKNLQMPHSGDYTYRELLGFIAGLYGGNFVMSDTGELLLIPLKGGG